MRSTHEIRRGARLRTGSDVESQAQRHQCDDIFFLGYSSWRLEAQYRELTRRRWEDVAGRRGPNPTASATAGYLESWTNHAERFVSFTIY